MNDDKSLIKCCCCKIVCAKCGDRDAQPGAPCSLCGAPTAKSDAEALALLQAHVEKGVPTAILYLGTCYESGWLGLERSRDESFKLFERCAGLEDDDDASVAASYFLGCAYGQGHGAPLDKGKMVECFLRAADRGFSRAQTNLGECYRLGDGVTRDDAEAVRYYRLAVDSGDAVAMCNLAGMHVTGRVVDGGDAASQMAAALELLDASAALGYAKATAATAFLRSGAPEGAEAGGAAPGVAADAVD